MKLLPLWAAVLLIAQGAAAEVSLPSLLREMTDPGLVARWPEPEYACRQASSYDPRQTAAENPDPFANQDQNQFIRAERVGEGASARTEHVMLDAAGPGAIVRFWLTTLKRDSGKVRIYLDGDSEPALVFAKYDLFTGGLDLPAPFLENHPGWGLGNPAGGTTLWLPIPYARHCKVTLEGDLGSTHCYQINTRTYAAGTAVRTFTAAQLSDARPLIDAAAETLLHPGPAENCRILERTLAVGSGGAAFDLPDGPGAVRGIEMKIDGEPSAETLRSLILRMECDGGETVWCPITDFFGSGVGVNALRSWYRSVEPDGAMRCRWTMPYARSARLTLLNLGKQPVPATVRILTGPWAWDARSMHFHAAWRNAALSYPPASDWNLINIKGSGVYIGDSLAIFNPRATWYGEGDEKIRVDGEAIPSHPGTGTEDYYGYSYAPKPLFQTPFCNLIREDEPNTQGWNVMCRTRNLDGIPFRKSLQMDFELIAWQPMKPFYSATTYWYARPGATCNAAPDAAAATARIPTLAEARDAAPFTRKGAIEFESIPLMRKTGEFETMKQRMEPWGLERWSGGAQFLGKAGKPGDAVEFLIPAEGGATPRRLVVYATQARDYGTLAFEVNGRPAGEFDGFSEEPKPGPAIALGVFAPENGVFRLRATVSGANAKAVGAKYYFALDTLQLAE